MSEYDDKVVTHNGVDKLAQGHGAPPADVLGQTGGESANPDSNPAFSGGGSTEATETPSGAFDPDGPAQP